MLSLDQLDDQFLLGLEAEKRLALETKLHGWGLYTEEFLGKLDAWFARFKNDEKSTALELFNNIDFFSAQRYERVLQNSQNNIQSRFDEQGIDWSNVLIVIPDEPDDSARMHTYFLTHIWKLPGSCIVCAPQLAKYANPESVLILFNDTYGSGEQFLKSMAPAVTSVKVRAVFVSAITLAQEAMTAIRKALPNAIFAPDTPARNAIRRLRAEEWEKIERMCERICPVHPRGFGRTALLTAYFFQCPNNTLPIVWANGKNNLFEGKGCAWSPLFEYTPKVRFLSPRREGAAQQSIERAQSTPDEGRGRNANSVSFSTSPLLSQTAMEANAPTLSEGGPGFVSNFDGADLPAELMQSLPAIGRSQEIIDLVARVIPGAVVSVTGPPDVGKSFIVSKALSENIAVKNIREQLSRRIGLLFVDMN